ncbi:MAG: citrulline utilization hydrolase CtlX [Candidatus Limnocylindrus sp.]
MNQSPHAALMINPLGFNPNPETAVDNAFQDAEIVDATERAAVAAEARVEVARIAEGLRGLGVEVLLIDDLPGSDVPDSVFPNNWISTHEDGRIVLYPMATPSRRRERRADVVEALRARYLVSDVIDLSAMEQDALYLEGTGALVLDHVNRVAYVARSGRAHTAAALRWCSAMEYDAEIFDTVDAHGAPIYHTNVVLSIGSEFVTAGLENIPDPTERARVLARLTASGREVVTLDPAQVAEFAGNGLELVGADGRRVFALSARAAAALRTDQRAQIERFAHVFPISIPTIERSGGSVRCTLAGIHLPPRGAAGG